MKAKPQNISRHAEFLAITDRFAGFQAQCLNVRVDFTLLQRLALPIQIGTAKFPGIKIQDTRMIRLMEVLLHGGTADGILQRDGRRYDYRLTDKGLQVALLFLFFHKRLCGPLANSLFHHRPSPKHQPNSKLEAAYHKAGEAIQKIIEPAQAA